MTRRLDVAAVIVLMWGVGTVCSVQAFDVKDESDEDDGDSKRYAILRVTDHMGVVRHEVVARQDVKDRRKRVIDAYETALKSHRARLKKSRKDEMAILFRRPAKPKTVVIGGNMSRTEAYEKAGKLQVEHLKRQSSGRLF